MVCVPSVQEPPATFSRFRAAAELLQVAQSGASHWKPSRGCRRRACGRPKALSRWPTMTRWTLSALAVRSRATTSYCTGGDFCGASAAQATETIETNRMHRTRMDMVTLLVLWYASVYDPLAATLHPTALPLPPVSLRLAGAPCAATRPLPPVPITALSGGREAHPRAAHAAWPHDTLLTVAARLQAAQGGNQVSTFTIFCQYVGRQT